MPKRPPRVYARILIKRLADPKLTSTLEHLTLLARLWPKRYGPRLERVMAGVSKMREAKRRLYSGVTVPKTAKLIGVSQTTLRKWLAGTMPFNTALIPKELAINRAHPEWGGLLGAIAARGTAAQGIKFYTQEKANAKAVLESFKAVSGRSDYNLRRKRVGGVTYYGFTVRDSALRDELARYMTPGGGERVVDSKSFTPQQKHRFLQAFFDNNATIRHNAITLERGDRKYGALMRQVQRMLLDRGIMSSLMQTRTGLMLRITGAKNISTFSERIGFSHSSKARELERLMKKPRQSEDYHPSVYYRTMAFAEAHRRMPSVEIAKEMGINPLSLRNWWKEGRRTGVRPKSVHLYESIVEMPPKEAEKQWLLEAARAEGTQEVVRKDVGIWPARSYSPRTEEHLLTKHIPRLDTKIEKLSSKIVEAPSSDFPLLNARLHDMETRVWVARELLAEATLARKALQKEEMERRLKRSRNPPQPHRTPSGTGTSARGRRPSG